MTDTARTHLALLRLHQRTAPLDARERVAAAAIDARAGDDLVPLATCHRVELYAALPADAAPGEWIARRVGLEPDALELRGATLLEDDDVARHLFRVVAGLDSALRGEGQIARQVRRAYERARESAPLAPVLARLFQHALHLARTLRSTSALGGPRPSIGSLAVAEAVAHLARPREATVLVVGAGEMGKLSARALGTRVGQVIVANRDLERAREVASLCGGEAIALADVGAALARADAVLSAADTRGAVLDRERMAARLALGPLVVVDIAVPRSVPDDARALPGLSYRDIDDLGARDDLPEDTVRELEGGCDAEAERFIAAERGRAAAETIRALHENAGTLREEHLARALGRLGHLAERDRRVVESLASSLTNALLHRPTVALKTDPEREPAARALFGLDVRP